MHVVNNVHTKVSFVVYRRDQGFISTSPFQVSRHGPIREDQRNIVERVGLLPLVQLPKHQPRTVDHPLIVTMTARWRPETNTTHLPTCIREMMPTLYDAWRIYHLNVTGEPVLTTDCQPYVTYINEWLEDCPEEVQLHILKFRWLKSRFIVLPKDATQVVIEQHMRAYLLYLVGRTIFSTTKDNEVPQDTLLCLKISNARDYMLRVRGSSIPVSVPSEVCNSETW
ncbi:hypothetical protein AMTR_s00046p00096620 [Amborella trichopoda]|uniref:Aminotransferase-like plant mobile domain-containing protein n=1 Tax=Amborella trichopoda TaxID=13333 RepID=U5D6B1_AMBTC|nr:hypothetical protein AMTR_s00046p00096620 [Amborella trichopoda]